MYLCIGNSQMESSDYEGAIYSFERARARMRYRVRFGLVAISLVSAFQSFGDMLEVVTTFDRYPAGSSMISA